MSHRFAFRFALRFALPSFIKLAAALPVFFLGLSGPGLRAQEPGVRHIVINELAPANQADHAIELYNYGLDQPMNGWQLRFKTSANGIPIDFNFPAGYILPRHSLVTIHYAAGSPTTTDLFYGSTQPFNNGAGEVLLKITGSGTGIDYIQFGSTFAPALKPADLPWTSGTFIGWPTATYGIARQLDPNTRSASDWYQPQPPDGPTLGQINTKQTGTRLYAPLLVNEFDRSTGDIEIYNPNNFAVNIAAMQIRGGDAVDATCGSFTFGGAATIAAGGFVTQKFGGCTAGWATKGTVRLLDPTGLFNNAWDSISFNFGSDLTMAGGVNRAFRKSDIPTASLSDWVVQTGTTNLLALNPGQSGPKRYDELGTVTSPSSPFNLGANSGIGMQVDLTRATSFKEVRVRMTTTATTAEIALYSLTGAPNSWTRVGGPFPLTVVNGVEQVYTTGPINVNFNSPRTMLATVFVNGPATLQQTPPGERFSYGVATGVNGYIGYPSPAGPVPMAGLDATRALQFYFWSVPGPAVQPEGSLKGAEVNYPMSQQFVSPVGTGTLTWSASGLPPGLSFATGTQILSGTATTAGTYGALQVTATDTVPLTDVNTYNFVVYAALQWVTATQFNDGEVGVPFNQPLVGTGGPPDPYTFAVVTGPLPAGLSLAGGALSGNPTAAVTNQVFTLSITDGFGKTVNKAFQQTIYAPLQVITPSLPGIDQNSVYNFTLQSANGAPGSLTWSLQSGSLPAGITLNPATGLLSGTATAAPGPNNFTVQVTDALGAVAAKGLSIQVLPPLSMQPAMLPDGEAGYGYSQTFTALGGNGVYSWAAPVGLPGFCTLGSGSGLLSCPSPSAGPVSLTVRLTDTSGGLLDRVYNFQFVVAPTVSTASLPDGEVSAAYNATATVSDGLAPFTWSAAGLPPGVNIAGGTGVLSGSPTVAGTFNVTLTVTDRKGATAQKVFTGVVVVPAVQITTPAGPLAVGEIGIPYSVSLAFIDGRPPAVFSLSGGALPAGLTLAANGTISGTPTAAGSSSFIIRITDALGGTDIKTYNIQIAVSPVILNTSLPKGVVQVAYPGINLIAQGGVPPYTYSIISGALPTGLTFSAGTGQFGGTPTLVEATSPTFRVTDNLGGFVTRVLSIQVINTPLPTDWSRRAQFSGGVGQIVLAPGYNGATKAIAFVTADSGGELFRSMDRGLTWQPFLVDGNNAGAPIHTLRLSPDFDYNGTSFSGSIYASTGAGGIYRSDDGGATFAPHNAGLPNTINPDGAKTTALTISPAYATDRTVWLAGQSGTTTVLYRSTTLPESWSQIFSFAAGMAGVAQLEVSPNYAVDNTLFAIYDNKMFKSTNGGVNWSVIYTPAAGRNFRRFVISPAYASTPAVFFENVEMVASVEQHYLLRSLDGGATWTQLGPQGYNLAFGYNGVRTALYFKNLGGNYALGMSEDLGNTFLPVYATGMRPQGPVFGSELAAGSVVGDLYSGTQGGLTVSTNNGDIFAPRQTGLATIKAASVSGAGNFVVAATDGGFLRSRDGGLTFVQVRNLRVSPSVVIEVPNLLLAGVSPSFALDKTFFLSVKSNFGSAIPSLYRTTDGGFTFTQVMYNDCRTLVFVPGFDSRVGQPQRTMYVGCLGGLFRSTDGGVTFTGLGSANGMDSRCNQSTRTETDGLGISPRLGGGYTLYRSGDGGICVSNDSGTTWTILLGGGGAPFIGTISSAPTNADSSTGVDKLSLRTDFLLYQIFYSTDGGLSWLNVKTPAITTLQGIVYARAYFSPNYAVDRLALIAVNRSFAAPGGLYRFDATTGVAQPLGGADLLRGRIITGIYMTPSFNGNNTTNSVALVTTHGGGLYRTTDGARTFQPVTSYDFESLNLRGMTRSSGGILGLAGGGKFIGPQAATTTTAGTLLTASDDGVFSSDDGGITFDDISLGLPDGQAVLGVTVPSLAVTAPLSSITGQGIYQYNGTQWTSVAAVNAGNFVNFTEDTNYLYAIRSDGVSMRADKTGSGWTALASGETNLVMASFNNSTQPTLASREDAFMGPRVPMGSNASLWSVSASLGPRYSTSSGASWTTTPGGNDYTLPAVSNYQVVKALGLNATTAAREVIAGYNGGLYKTRDGGDTWRSLTGAGSGLEGTAKNFTAILTTATAFATTDILVGASGTSATGGVYLSGDGGEHWSQINSGYDSATLSITSLISTSCSGCPVQYYSGAYGGGLYTRTVSVVAPPFYTTSASWCTGSGCTCGTGAFTGPEEGGQAFKLCGSNFASGAVIEFDGVPVYTNYSGGGCTVSSTQIVCPSGASGTPAHTPGAAQVRVRNSDTRATNLPVNYTYTVGTPRTASLTVAKSGSDALLTWTCTGCDAAHPARLYRAQNTAYSQYLEIYNGGISGTYTNTGALSSAQSYFWNVE